MVGAEVLFISPFLKFWLRGLGLIRSLNVQTLGQETNGLEIWVRGFGGQGLNHGCSGFTV